MRSTAISKPARGLDDAPGDRAFDVVTIDRARISANAANRLESVLADVAGLQQFRAAEAVEGEVAHEVAVEGDAGRLPGRRVQLGQERADHG